MNDRPAIPPDLMPLYESAKKMHIAKLRMEQAEREAKALAVVAEAYRKWRGARGIAP